MKRQIIALLCTLGAVSLNAQWNTSGNNIYNTNTGNVGIGVTNANEKLQLVGNFDLAQHNFIRSSRLYWQANNNSSGLNANTRGIISNNIIWDNASGSEMWRVPSGGTSLDFAMLRFQAGGTMSFFTAPINQTVSAFTNAELESFRRMTILNNGNVGIGTANPGQYKLAVEGTIGARKVTVTQDAWADYVFDKDYILMPLDKVKAFIEQNKHLPGVPSAKEVAANGIDLGDTQAVLLKKIEELTLYLIEMKNENTKVMNVYTEVKNENEMLKKRIEALEGYRR